MKAFRAAPYVINGMARPGKMHAIREDGCTYCGAEPADMGGEILDCGRGEVSCKRCVRSLDSHDRQEQWRAESAQRDAEREEENREWWEWYSAYLDTPAWARLRRLVLQRAEGLCEGCRLAMPVHVHHLTYAHAGGELLYELVALCRECHQKVHPGKEIAP